MPAAARKKPAARSPQPAGSRAVRNARALERARAGHKTSARTAPANPRRKSGPARGTTAARSAAAPRKAAAAPRKATAPARATVPRQAGAPRTVARPLARAAQGGASVVLDSLLRGRAWVVLVGALLAGIVFLNVSVLELNRGIARTDAKASALERGNSAMREKVAKLDSAERIQRLAEMRGFVLPQPGQVTYLRPDRDRDARLAVARLQEQATEEPVAPQPTEVATPAPVAAPTPTETAAPVAPSPTSATPPTVEAEPVAATAPAAAP